MRIARIGAHRPRRNNPPLSTIGDDASPSTALGRGAGVSVSPPTMAVGNSQPPRAYARAPFRASSRSQ